MALGDPFSNITAANLYICAHTVANGNSIILFNETS